MHLKLYELPVSNHNFFNLKNDYHFLKDSFLVITPMYEHIENLKVILIASETRLIIIHAKQSIESFLESISYLLAGTLLSPQETSISCSVYIQEQ